MAQRDKFYGDVIVLGSISGSSITGSLFGTASFASTASYVNPLSQNVVITGSASNSLLVKGSGTTSATNTLLVQNSNASASLQVRDDRSTLFVGSNGVASGNETGTYIDPNGTLRIQRSINGATYGLRIWNGAGWSGHNAIEALSYQYPIYGAQGSNGSEQASPLNAGAAIHGKGGVGVYGTGVTPSGDTGSIGVLGTTLFVNSAANTVLYDRLAAAHIIGLGVSVSGSALKVHNSANQPILVGLDNRNVGINTGTPQYNLDVNGITRSTKVATGIMYNETSDANTPRRISLFGVGGVAGGLTPSAIRIVTPGRGNNHMLKYIIDIYSYSSKMFTVEIGGYDNGGSWSDRFAKCTDSSILCRVGNSASGEAVLYIGDYTQSWGTYGPAVVIREVQIYGWQGNINTNSDLYKDPANYSYSLVTGSGTDTIRATFTNTGYDTLNTITTTGNTTTNSITVGGLTSTGSFNISGSSRFVGNVTITGSLTATSITGSFTGSYTGSLFGTSSFASTASYVNPLSQTVALTGSLQIKGTDTSQSTKVFHVQTGDGTSIMDFRNNTYAFFGCGQGGGSASGFIFRYTDTNYTQFVGYNYGGGSGAYKPILLDTDVGGRNKGIFVNYDTTVNTPPASTEFAVRGQGATSATFTAKFQNSGLNDVLTIRDDGNVRVTGSLTVTGSINSTSDITAANNITARVNLKSMYQAGDEGGEIFLNVPATNTTINNGVNIDVYQDKLRIWEDGGANRGYYLDMTAGASGVGTNLKPAGYTGTVTILGNPPGSQNLNFTDGILISVT